MKIGTELKPYTSGTGGRSIFMEQLAECNEQPADYSSTVIASIVVRLKEALHYDPETGIFTGKEARGNLSIGKQVGGLHHTGYRYIMLDGKRFGAHRLAWLYMYGEWPKENLDHINGDRSDNRITNLREATDAENHQNRKKPITNTSGYMGVTYHRGNSKWHAQISVNNKRKHLGNFDTPEEAFKAYMDAKKLYHPFNNVITEDVCEAQADYSSMVLANTVKALTGTQSTTTTTSFASSVIHISPVTQQIMNLIELRKFFNEHNL